MIYKIFECEIRKFDLEDYILTTLYKHKFYFTTEDEVHDFVSEIEHDDIFSFLNEKNGWVYRRVNTLKLEELEDVEIFVNNNEIIFGKVSFISDNLVVEGHSGIGGPAPERYVEVKVATNIHDIEYDPIDIIKKVQESIKNRFYGIEYK